VRTLAVQLEKTLDRWYKGEFPKLPNEPNTANAAKVADAPKVASATETPKTPEVPKQSSADISFSAPPTSNPSSAKTAKQ
jgi:hypothetical protein